MTTPSGHNRVYFLDRCACFFDDHNSSASGWNPPHDYPAHTEVVRQDTTAKFVYFVESGLLKLSRIDHTGHEVIAGLRCRQWITEVPAVLLGKPYSFTVTTIAPSSLRSISATSFLELVEKDTHFSRQVLTMLSQEMSTQVRNLVSLGCLPAIDRLKQLLYDIIVEIERPAELKRQVKIRVPLKHREMAQMTAVTSEHFCRLLKRLEQENIVSRDKGWLVVEDVERLGRDLGM